MEGLRRYWVLLRKTYDEPYAPGHSCFSVELQGGKTLGREKVIPCERYLPVEATRRAGTATARLSTWESMILFR